MARLEGVEPPTLCCEGRCSIQLSYRRSALALPDKQARTKKSGAAEWIRTTTVLLPPAPQAGASASSATTAKDLPLLILSVLRPFRRISSFTAAIINFVRHFHNTALVVFGLAGHKVDGAVLQIDLLDSHWSLVPLR